MRQESRCWLIWDSSTLLWHTGQVTVRAIELRRVLPTPDAPAEGTSAPVPSSLRSLENEEDDADAGEWLSRWKKSEMCVEFPSSRHLFLPPVAVPGLCGLVEADAGINAPDFSGVPESLDLELGMLEGAPVPELLWLPKCLKLEPGVALRKLEELAPDVPIPELL